MTISIKTWIKEYKSIINYRYIRKRLNFQFIIGVIHKIILESKNKNAPWLTTESIRTLTNWIRPNDLILEFGSGQSTLWFCSKTTKVISVEHNKTWYNLIKKQLHQHKIKYIYAKNKKTYLAVFNKIKDNSVDVCLIDGQYRRDCLLNAFRKIKVGGLIVFDNAETYLPVTWPSNSFQDRWQDRGCPELAKVKKISQALKKFRMIVTSDVTQDTIFFIKEHN